MRTLLLASLLISCKSPAQATVDAGLVSSAPMPALVSTADAGAGTAALASVAEAAEPAPLTTKSMSFSLVAIGAKYGSKLLSMQLHGDHVWLSGRGIDAHAEGAAPLAKGPDPLAGLPYKQKEDVVRVVGTWPNLYATRTADQGYLVTVFVRREHGWDEAGRIESESLTLQDTIAWKDGALIVRSAHRHGGEPQLDGPGPGTVLHFVGPKGDLGTPTLSFAREFIAWKGIGAGESLALVGTLGKPTDDKHRAFDPALHVLWGTEQSMRDTRMFATGFGTGTYAQAIALRGSTLVVGQDRNSEAFHDVYEFPSVPPLWTIVDGKPKALGARLPEGCVARDLVVGDGRVYFTTFCLPQPTAPALVTAPLDGGKAERIPLPKIAKKAGGGFTVATAEAGALACLPYRVLLRGPADLWVAAWCGTNDDAYGEGSIPAVFRTGPAQQPIVLP